MGIFLALWLLFSPTTYANAEEPNNQEQVVISPVEQIQSLETAIIAAESVLTNIVSESTEYQVNENISSIQESQLAVQQAVEAKNQAQQALSEVVDATAEKDIAKEELDSISISVNDINIQIQNQELVVNSVEDALQQAQDNVDIQIDIVDQAQNNLDQAEEDLIAAQEILDEAPIEANTVNGLTLTSYKISTQQLPQPTTVGLTPSSEVLVVPTLQENDYWDGQLGSLDGDFVMLQYSADITPFTTGNINFATVSDDGVILKINNEVVIDNWTLHGPTWDQGSYNFTTTDPIAIELLFYEWGGGAWIDLRWENEGVWEIIPSSAFTTTGMSKDPELIQAVINAQDTVNDKQYILETETYELNTLIEIRDAAQEVLDQENDQLYILQETQQEVNSYFETKNIEYNNALETLNNAIDNFNIMLNTAQTQTSYASLKVSATVLNIESTPESYIPPVIDNGGQTTPTDSTPVVDPVPVDPTPTDPSDETPSEGDGSQDTDTPGSDDSSSNDEQDNNPEESQGTEDNSQNNDTPSMEEVQNLVDELSSDGVLTLAEKEQVADLLIEAANGNPISAADMKEAGLEFRDLPPETPVEIRTDANDNPVVITAEVASALLTLVDPAAFIGGIAACINPDEAIEGLTEEQKCEIFKALGNIGADMSPQERQDATEVLVAAILVGQVILGSSILRIRG